MDTTQHSGTIVRARTNLCKCYVLPALLYGAAEAWALAQAQLTGIAAVHNTFLRRILGRRRRGPGGVITTISNAKLFRLTGAKPLSAHLNELRLRRLPDSSVVKQILFADRLLGGPTGNVVGGRRTSWFRLAKSSLRSMQIENTWYDLAQDRSEWSAVCSRASDNA